MSFLERIIHAILFEAGALLVSALAVVFAGLGNPAEATGVGVAISLIALLWNLLFNWVYDKFSTGAREKRTLNARIVHSLLFEGGLLVFTLPLIMFVLNVSLVEAFLIDISLTLLILVYTVIFNWIYDHLRLRWV